MGCTIFSQLFIGVSLDKIASVETSEQKFELHDTRTGEKTGKFEKEVSKVLRVIGKPDSKISDSRIYSDQIEFKNKEFDEIKGYDCNYEGGSDELGVYFVGVEIAKTPYDQSDSSVINQRDLSAKFEHTKSLFKDEFGYDGDLELIVRQYYSC